MCYFTSQFYFNHFKRIFFTNFFIVRRSIGVLEISLFPMLCLTSTKKVLINKKEKIRKGRRGNERGGREGEFETELKNDPLCHMLVF